MKHSFIIFSMCLALSSVIYARVVRVMDETQYNEIIQGNKPVLVEFSAEWCSVCNKVQKSLDEIAKEPEFSNITFAQVDVDKCDAISKQNGIVGVPTFVYMENGKKKVEEIGVQNMPEFPNHLRTNLRKTFQANENEQTQKVANPTMQTEEVEIEATAPAAQPEQAGMFMQIIHSIQSFFMMIITQISNLFSTVINAITGLFAK